MAQDYLTTNRPSQTDAFSDKVKLFLAMRTGDLTQVKTMLKKKPGLINEHQTWDRKSLGPGSEQFIQALFKNDTPLNCAARRGDVALTDLLIEHGADVNLKTMNGTPLQQATMMNHQAVVERLLSAGADSTTGDPLLIVVTNGYHGIADLLLQQGLDPNQSNQHGLTYLHWAAMKGHWATVEILLKHGATSEVKDNMGRTPLAWAEQNEQASVIEVLRYHEQANARLVVGEGTMGRTLNTKGEALDGLETEIEGPKWAINRPAPAEADRIKPTEIYETGIKIIDLLAPMVRGGRISIFSPQTGLGQMVQIGEMIRRLALKYQAPKVFLGADVVTPDEVRDWLLPLLELGHEKDTSALLEQNVQNPTVQARLVKAGTTMVEYYRDELGSDSLLVLDINHIPPKALEAVEDRLTSTRKGAISILYYGDQDAGETVPVDSTITFTARRSKSGLWPAIDPLGSRSQGLQPPFVSEQHAQVVQQVRQIFEHYENIYEQAETEGIETLTMENQQVVHRARRLDRFFTQPFLTAEHFTGLPGEFVPLEETLKGCQGIVEGAYDDVPEEAFMFTGTIEQVLTKAKQSCF